MPYNFTTQYLVNLIHTYHRAFGNHTLILVFQCMRDGVQIFFNDHDVGACIF